MPKSYGRCCGIDVHKKSIQVCVLPPAEAIDVKRSVLTSVFYY